MVAVKGISEAVSRLNRMPEAVRVRLQEALPKAAQVILEDMQAFTPVDGLHGGAHAREGLNVKISDDGLQANIGLPTQQDVNDYFWFRFLDGGTKGGEVKYWKRDASGKRTRHTMQVPSRPALRIREKALDANEAKAREIIMEAIQAGLDEA